MSNEQIDAAPIPFQWSTRDVVFHISDFDLIYADHMKRVIAESEPRLFDGDGKLFANRLAYDKRDVDEEVRMIKAVRRHMGHILRSIGDGDFLRKGLHAEDGPLTLADLLKRAADHIPHHAQYIEEKRKALSIGERSLPFRPIFQLHELFDKLAAELLIYVDLIAERATALGGMALGTVRMSASNSQLHESELDVTDSLPMVESVAERYAALAASTRQAIESADCEGDADTADLLTEVSRGLDKSLWFLEAHLQTQS